MPLQYRVQADKKPAFWMKVTTRVNHLRTMGFLYSCLMAILEHCVKVKVFLFLIHLNLRQGCCLLQRRSMQELSSWLTRANRSGDTVRKGLFVRVATWIVFTHPN